MKTTLLLIALLINPIASQAATLGDTFPRQPQPHSSFVIERSVGTTDFGAKREAVAIHSDLFSQFSRLKGVPWISETTNTHSRHGAMQPPGTKGLIDFKTHQPSVQRTLLFYRPAYGKVDNNIRQVTLIATYGPYLTSLALLFLCVLKGGVKVRTSSIYRRFWLRLRHTRPWQARQGYAH